MRLVAAPHPFKVETVDTVVPDGLTLAEAFALAQPDPIFRLHAHIWIDGQYVYRDYWHTVRPKPGSTITIRVIPQGGGGGGGGKNPLRTILTIGVIAASFYFGPQLGAALAPGGAGASATVFGSLTYGQLGGAIIAVSGTLLTNVIAPIRPPTLPALSGTSTQRDSPTLFIDGARNAIRPFTAIPSVLGVHRSVPPLGAKTFTEIVGKDNYLRVLAVWGYGPLDISDIKIGETPIADFDGVEIETREGRAGDAAITLYPDSVSQQNIAVLLNQADSWNERTVDPDADELSVDVTFQQGLTRFNNQGGRSNQSVAIQIQYRESGGSPAAPWSTPTFTATTADSSWISGDTVTFTHNRTGAIRHGFRWSVPSRGTYEIRLRRTTADTTDSQVFDKVTWTAHRSITDEDPLNFSEPLAVTALSIKATDQLNRVVDELNATVSSYVTSYTGGSPAWSEAISSNPADLFRHVLQGAANARPLADARIDLTTLQNWHDFCATNGFEFNMIRDFQASVWDTLADICAAGRASPAQVDGKWTVVYDYQQTAPVQHFTPRNSWGFEAEKSFPDQPDAFRVRFINREKDYRNDERIVYADGFDANSAENFDGLTAPGITDPEHIWKFARFTLAQAQLRPERWTFNTDFEYIVARRGNLVNVTHDVLLVGLASGRIKSLTYDTSSPAQVTGFVSDEVLTMEAGNDYGISARSVSNAEITSQIVTNAGDQTTVVFSTPLAQASAPVAGDLFGFGLLGSETISGILLSIEPLNELSARLVCIPESPAVYTSDTGTIPAFDSKLTALDTIPNAEVENVRSDESILQLGAGNTLIPQIGFSVVSVDDDAVSLDIQIRSTGNAEPFAPAIVNANVDNEYLIGNVEEGSYYDIRARWRDPNRLPGSWTTIAGHRVVGSSSAPDALQNATISAYGGQAYIRWDRPAELDVRFGGEVRFRHSQQTDASLAEWPTSTSIGEAARGDALFSTLPLKPGTYLAKVFDKSGRPSAVVKLSTKQASVLTYANVSTIDEDPAFVGTHVDTIVDGSTLKLTGVGLFDDIPDFDTVADLDAYGGIELVGTYNFAANTDLTTVKRVRITSRVTASAVNVLDLIDDRTEDIDDWEDFDGIDGAQTDVKVFVRHTDDDPTGSPVSWSDWERLDSAEFEARGFEYYAELTSNDPAFNVSVTDLGVDIEELM